jgi:hypothetical protein
MNLYLGGEYSPIPQALDTSGIMSFIIPFIIVIIIIVIYLYTGTPTTVHVAIVR